jgi:hypothetical protein
MKRFRGFCVSVMVFASRLCLQGSKGSAPATAAR